MIISWDLIKLIFNNPPKGDTGAVDSVSPATASVIHLLTNCWKVTCSWDTLEPHLGWEKSNAKIPTHLLFTINGTFMVQARTTHFL